MTERFHPLMKLRAAVEQIGHAVSASEEYTRAAAADRKAGIAHRRLGQNTLYIPL